MTVGSAINEIIKQKVISPVEKCWVESEFCAFLVLRYDDPENPQLEAMIRVCLNYNYDIVVHGMKSMKFQLNSSYSLNVD